VAEWHDGYAKAMEHTHDTLDQLGVPREANGAKLYIHERVRAVHNRAVRVIARLLALHEGPSADDAKAEAERLLQAAAGVVASDCVWPTKPLKLVQVTLPDGTSAALPPERAYFDAWAMQELENKLKGNAGVPVTSTASAESVTARAAVSMPAAEYSPHPGARFCTCARGSPATECREGRVCRGMEKAGIDYGSCLNQEGWISAPLMCSTCRARPEEEHGESCPRFVKRCECGMPEEFCRRGCPHGVPEVQP